MILASLEQMIGAFSIVPSCPIGLLEPDSSPRPDSFELQHGFNAAMEMARCVAHSSPFIPTLFLATCDTYHSTYAATGVVVVALASLAAFLRRRHAPPAEEAPTNSARQMVEEPEDLGTEDSATVRVTDVALSIAPGAKPVSLAGENPVIISDQVPTESFHHTPTSINEFYRINGGDPNAILWEAACLDALGRRAEAWQILFRLLIELNPDDPLTTRCLIAMAAYCDNEHPYEDLRAVINGKADLVTQIRYQAWRYPFQPHLAHTELVRMETKAKTLKDSFLSGLIQASIRMAIRDGQAKVRLNQIV